MRIAFSGLASRLALTPPEATDYSGLRAILKLIMQPQLIRELVALLGPKAVLSQAEDLMLYEYDGSVELGSPKCIVFPSSTREVSEIVRLANRYRDSAGRARRGHGAFGRSHRARRRHRGRVLAHESHSRNRCGESARRRPARRRESRSLARRRASGPVFRARSFQPEIVHDRRKRFRKFRRAAHAGLWRDDESRDRPRTGAARRRNRAHRRQERRDSGLRPGRAVRRLRRDAGAGHGNYRAAHAQSRKR